MLLGIQTWLSQKARSDSRRLTWAFVINALIFLAVFIVLCSLQYFFALYNFDFKNSAEIRRYGIRAQKGENAQDTVFALQRSVGMLLFSEIMVFVSMAFIFYDILLIILYYNFHLAVKEYKKIRDFFPDLDNILGQTKEKKSKKTAKEDKTPDVPTKSVKAKV